MSTPGLEGIKSIEELDLFEKKVFLRLDLNVPCKNGKIVDDTRIRGAIPTIKYLIDKKCKIIMASHMGRPKTKEDFPKFSLEPVAERLSELLGVDVILLEDPMGEGIRGLIPSLGNTKLLLLENTRFVSGEESNSHQMASHFAGLVDAYVDDAFGAIHRAHATVDALPRLMKAKAVGFLIKKEVEMLDKIIHKGEHPIVAILGGAKVSDKIGVIENLMETVDCFVIGGAMAYTFLMAQGIAVGRSLVEKEKVNLAKELLHRFQKRNKKLVLPVDHVVATELKEGVATKVTDTQAVPADLAGFDIGPKTIELIKEALSKAKTVVWNGPMGAFETKPFEKGTFAVASLLSESKAFVLVGGGDSVTAVEQAGLASKMGHISTGGGASLEYLEGIKLPGLDALKND